MKKEPLGCLRLWPIYLLTYLHRLFFIAASFGDPHLVTLDGFQYTFNGLGDYHMLQAVTEDTTVKIQSRTCKAFVATGTVSKATVFCGFAITETDEPVISIYLNITSMLLLIRNYSPRT